MSVTGRPGPGWRAPLAGRPWLRQKLGLTGLVVLILVGLISLAAPYLATRDPRAQDLENKLQAPSARHPLGTDQLGRDVLARVMHGGRNTLGGALLALA